MPDSEVLNFATAERRAVLTLNRKDFTRLHLLSSAHAGIMVCAFDPNFRTQAEWIHQAIEAEHDLAGKLIRVSRPR